MSSKTPDQLTADVLKDRKDREDAAYPENLALRVHRAISWIRRAEMAEEDPDIGFTCYWIAFSSAYTEDTGDSVDVSERELFQKYFNRLLGLDSQGAIYEAIWRRFSGPVRVLLKNKYVYRPDWKHANGVDGYGKWEEWFDHEQKLINRALATQETPLILTRLFDRLYVLRNQILHGGATWNSSVNRDQVRDGAAIMGFLIPLFIKVMMDHPNQPWGANYYPVMDVQN